MLVRFYSITSDSQPSLTNPPTLSDRLLRECAGMCIEAAQGITSLITETLEPGEPVGLIP